MSDPAAVGVRRRLVADPLRLVLVAIAAITIASGLTQIVAPGFVLDRLSVDNTEATRQLFATVGMFMVLFGGMLIHALLDRAEHPIVVFWAALQKLGASAAVGIGVARGVVSGVALLVAGFDLLSGALGLAFWRRIRR
jgi:hypothetical protein